MTPFFALLLQQNSRDNMSVILVTFPSAPKVSPEAIEKVHTSVILLNIVWYISYQCLPCVQEEKLQKEAKKAIDTALQSTFSSQSRL